ncbi:MAG: hypothetical protein RJA99_2533 [Pseudomonadota bacterium]|jgi:hypothetical protein
MKLKAALSLLAVVALLTPLGAMIGLYDTTFDEVAGFAGPAIGAGTAILFTRLVSRRA